MVAFPQGLLQAHVFIAHLLDVKLFVDNQLHLSHGEGFQHIVAGAGFHCVHGSFNAAIGGHHNERQSGIQALPFLQKLKTIHARQLQVRHHKVHRCFAQMLQSAFSVA